jgi:hypothetical protein
MAANAAGRKSERPRSLPDLDRVEIKQAVSREWESADEAGIIVETERET